MYVCFNAWLDSCSFGCPASILLLAWELELQANSLLSCSLDLWWCPDPSHSSIMCNRTEAWPIIFPHPPCHSEHSGGEMSCWSMGTLLKETHPEKVCNRVGSKRANLMVLELRGASLSSWSAPWKRGSEATHGEQGKQRSDWMSMSLSECLGPALKMARLCFCISSSVSQPFNFALPLFLSHWSPPPCCDCCCYITLCYWKRNHLLASLLRGSGWSSRFQVI